MTENTTPAVPDDRWRQAHLGRLLGHAMRRFDERVLALMTHDAEVPLALSNLAARGQVGAAHIHITRHLALGGSRLTDLAIALAKPLVAKGVGPVAGGAARETAVARKGRWLRRIRRVRRRSSRAWRSSGSLFRRASSRTRSFSES